MIFYFESYGSLIACRDNLKVALPIAFHISQAAIARLGIVVPPREPIGEAWI